jgi:hypothetical protein
MAVTGTRVVHHEDVVRTVRGMEHEPVVAARNSQQVVERLDVDRLSGHDVGRACRDE